MKYKCDLSIIYKQGEWEKEYQELNKKVMIGLYKKSDFKYAYIKLQNLQLYLLLAKRLNYYIPRVDVNSQKLNKMATYLSNIHPIKSSEKGEVNKELCNLIKELEKLTKSTFVNCLQKDLKFGYINKKEITVASYVKFLQDKDYDIRKEAYNKFYGTINQYKNVLANLYIINGKLYKTKLNNIYHNKIEQNYEHINGLPENFLKNLFDAYDENKATIHKYYRFKSKKLKKIIEPEDLLAPVYSYCPLKFDIYKAYEIICGAMKPLGIEYVACIKDLFNEGRLDIYDYVGKYKGSFTVCSYEKGPFSSVNFENNSLNDLLTLSHEIGHAIHYKMSIRKNNINGYKVPLIESEVASMVNELLLYNYLQKNAVGDNKQYFIFRELEDLEGGIFRQCRLGEFEYNVSLLANEELSSELLLKLYERIQKKYYGDSVKLTEYSNLECLRTPQLYDRFYVLNYCIGAALALKIVANLLENEEYGKKYLNYLSSSSKLDVFDRMKILDIEFDIKKIYDIAIKEFEIKLSKLT